MSPQLAAALMLIAETGSDLGDWWIIGSTALTLHGIDAGEPNDVDLFGPSSVMLALLGRLGTPVMPAKPNDRFSSHPYQRVCRIGMTDIEVMGDLKVATGGDWTSVAFASRHAVNVEGRTVFVPDLQEQIELFRLFGRPKDLEKAMLAERLPR